MGARDRNHRLGATRDQAMKRVLWWTFVAPLGFLALCAVVLFLFKEKTRRDLNAYKAKLVSKGETFDLSKLGPTFPRETDEPIRQFIAACKEAEEFAKNEKHPNPLSDKLNKDGTLAVTAYSDTARYRGMNEKSDRRPTWNEIAKGFEEYETLISHIRDMARTGKLEFHPDYSTKGLLPMPYIGNFLSAITLLYGDTLIQLKKGNASRAIEDTEAIIRIGQIMQKQPPLICRLVACSTYKDAAGITWQIIHSDKASAAQLLALQQIWQTVDPMKDLALTFRMERGFNVSNFSNPNRLLGLFIGDEPYQTNISKLDLTDQVETLANIAIWRLVLVHIDEQQTLSSLEQLIAAIDESDRSGDLAKLGIEADRVFDSARASWLLVNRTATPSTTSVIRGCVETRTIVNLTMTALVLERYRIETGAYPPALEALAPDYIDKVPVDPYDNSPLRYQKTGDQFLLYSISDNLTDDHGDIDYTNTLRNKPFERGNDIVWPLPEPTS
jgi:hypothetical protein